MGAGDLAGAPPAGYGQYATFQPTFLYELIWDLALAAVLVWLGHHRRIRPPGLFALYVAGYSAFRIFEETLRIDSSEHFLGLRLNFFVALSARSPGWPGSSSTSAAPTRPRRESLPDELRRGRRRGRGPGGGARPAADRRGAADSDSVPSTPPRNSARSAVVQQAKPAGRPGGRPGSISGS